MQTIKRKSQWSPTYMGLLGLCMIATDGMNGVSIVKPKRIASSVKYGVKMQGNKDDQKDTANATTGINEKDLDPSTKDKMHKETSAKVVTKGAASTQVTMAVSEDRSLGSDGTEPLNHSHSYSHSYSHSHNTSQPDATSIDRQADIGTQQPANDVSLIPQIIDQLTEIQVTITENAPRLILNKREELKSKFDLFVSKTQQSENENIINIMDPFIFFFDDIEMTLNEHNGQMRVLGSLLECLRNGTAPLAVKECNPAEIVLFHSDFKNKWKKELSSGEPLAAIELKTDRVEESIKLLTEGLQEFETVCKWESEFIRAVSKSGYQITVDGTSFDDQFSSEIVCPDLAKDLSQRYRGVYENYRAAFKHHWFGIQNLRSQLFITTSTSKRLLQCELTNPLVDVSDAESQQSGQILLTLDVDEDGRVQYSRMREKLNEAANVVHENMQKRNNPIAIPFLPTETCDFFSCSDELIKLNEIIVTVLHRSNPRVANDIDLDLNKSVSISYFFLRREELKEQNEKKAGDVDNQRNRTCCLFPFAWMNSIGVFFRQLCTSAQPVRFKLDSELSPIDMLRFSMHRHCQIVYVLAAEITSIFLADQSNSPSADNITLTQVSSAVQFIRDAVRCEFNEVKIVEYYPELRKKTFSLTETKKIYYAFINKTDEMLMRITLSVPDFESLLAKIKERHEGLQGVVDQCQRELLQNTELLRQLSNIIPDSAETDGSILLSEEYINDMNATIKIQKQRIEEVQLTFNECASKLSYVDNILQAKKYAMMLMLSNRELLT